MAHASSIPGGFCWLCGFTWSVVVGAMCINTLVNYAWITKVKSQDQSRIETVATIANDDIAWSLALLLPVRKVCYLKKNIFQSSSLEEVFHHFNPTLFLKNGRLLRLGKLGHFKKVGLLLLENIRECSDIMRTSWCFVNLFVSYLFFQCSPRKIGVEGNWSNLTSIFFSDALKLPSSNVNPGCLKFTLPETNSSHLKMDGWNISFLLGWPIFRCNSLVSGSVAGDLFWVETTWRTD